MEGATTVQKTLERSGGLSLCVEEALGALNNILPHTGFSTQVPAADPSAARPVALSPAGRGLGRADDGRPLASLQLPYPSLQLYAELTKGHRMLCPLSFYVLP